MVDRKLVSSEPALLGEQGSHCGQDCWSNGDKKHAVANIVILYSIGLDLIDWFGLVSLEGGSHVLAWRFTILCVPPFPCSSVGRCLD